LTESNLCIACSSDSEEVCNLISIARTTYNQFWRDYKEGIPPKSAEISHWIVKTYKISVKHAESIDRMIRPAKMRDGSAFASLQGKKWRHLGYGCKYDYD